jgi:membrane associated rhomboid family serine protease
MFPLADTNRAHRLPVVTWVIIVLNIIAFFIEIAFGSGSESRWFLFQFGFVPAYFATHVNLTEMSTLLTNQFLHGGWMHLIGNMWFLHIFGDNVEDKMGHLAYLLFYLTCGMLANIAQFLADPGMNGPIIGASGAIAGVMGAYLYLFPYARVNSLLLLGIVPIFLKVPALIYVGFWFLLNTLSASFPIDAAAAEAETTAWWCHIGGFLAGFLLVRFLETPRRKDSKFYADQYYPW